MLSQYRHPVGAILLGSPRRVFSTKKVKTHSLRRSANSQKKQGSKPKPRASPGIDQFFTRFLSESLRIYLARDLTESSLEYERTEEEADMQYRWIPLTQAVAEIHAGYIHNATTINGVLAAASALAGYGELRDPSASWLR